VAAERHDEVRVIDRERHVLAVPRGAGDRATDQD